MTGWVNGLQKMSLHNAINAESLRTHIPIAAMKPAICFLFNVMNAGKSILVAVLRHVSNYIGYRKPKGRYYARENPKR